MESAGAALGQSGFPQAGYPQAGFPQAGYPQAAAGISNGESGTRFWCWAENLSLIFADDHVMSNKSCLRSLMIPQTTVESCWVLISGFGLKMCVGRWSLVVSQCVCGSQGLVTE